MTVDKAFRTIYAPSIPSNDQSYLLYCKLTTKRTLTKNLCTSLLWDFTTDLFCLPYDKGQNEEQTGGYNPEKLPQDEICISLLSQKQSVWQHCITLIS